MAVEEFVDGLSGAAPVAVVVDDEDATGLEPGVEVDEFMEGGFVPVGVEAEEGDLIREGFWDGLLDPALNEMDVVRRVAGGVHDAGDVGEIGMAPDASAFGLGGEQGGGGGALGVDVEASWRGHALEGVVEEEVAVGLAEGLESAGGDDHVAATPDAAFDDGAGDGVLDEVTDGILSGGESVKGGEGEGAGFLEDRSEFGGEIGGEGFENGVPDDVETEALADAAGEGEEGGQGEAEESSDQ